MVAEWDTSVWNPGGQNNQMQLDMVGCCKTTQDAQDAWKAAKTSLG